MSAKAAPWDTLITSVGRYIVIPVILAQLLRKALLAKGRKTRERAVLTLGLGSVIRMFVQP
jgi:ACR3 family arsenite transporter